MPVDSPSLVSTLVLAAMVAVIGMPHGGLDHLFGRAVFEPVVGRWWRVAFAASYLGVAATVVAGWFLAPMATILLFFLISAFHFGEDSDAAWPLAMLSGGLVIWLPCLARTDEVVQSLAWIVPSDRADSIRDAAVELRPLLQLLLVIFVGHLIALAFDVRHRLEAFRLAASAALFALVPTTVGFAVYFCGWHSTREMVALARRVDPNDVWRGLRAVVVLAAPRAGVAVIVTAGAAWWFADGRDLQPVAVQAVFMGLSAVAVPHILLWIAADRLGADPFRAGEIGGIP